MHKLQRLAYHEYKVTRQVSTGNGESYLAQSERPTGAFIMGELGYGQSERPCSDCYKPCTLDYTLGNLDEINSGNLHHLNARDPLDVPHRISSVDGLVREHFKLDQAPTAPPKTAHGCRNPKKCKRCKKTARRERLTADDAQRQLRAQARRAGFSVIKGGFVDERRRTWTPGSTTREQREAMAADALGRALASMCRRLRRQQEQEQKQNLVAA